METNNKLRDALTKILHLTNSLDENCAVDPVEIRDIARAALAAPPRNCDRPECATTKTAQEVWRREDGGKTAYYEWLLATYKEGGNEEPYQFAVKCKSCGALVSAEEKVDAIAAWNRRAK